MPSPSPDSSHLADPVTRHMRADFARLALDQTVGAAIAAARAAPPEGRIIYFYVLDAEGRLAGVVPTRRLLLSPDAEADSLPGLEIEANDVKCSHGATTGQVDENELFYLRTRGIPLEVAQELLAQGFLEEVIAKVEDEEGAEALRGMLSAKFHQV